MSRSTFSKNPERYPPGYPERLVAGHGAYVWDEDGKQYIDWCQGLSGIGPLGHAHQKVVEAVTVALRFGTAFHLPHKLEDEVAWLLCEIFDYADDVRFCLNGTDATAGAIRLARAVTGRTTVITFENAYHGMSTGDWQICGAEPARGIPKEYPKPIKVEWNNCRALAYALGRYRPAAVIFEVPTEDPTQEFVENLHAISAVGALLIADEVVTGFRFGLHGACGEFGINPDLACFGKGLGAGFPIAALVGRKDLIDEFYSEQPPFMSFTHAGNTVGLAAAKATIEVLREFNWPKFQNIGTELKAAFNREFNHLGAEAVGQPSRHQFRFQHDYQFQAFIGECAKHGVLFGITNSPTIRHGGGVLERTISVMKRYARWAVETSEPVSDVRLYDVRGRDVAGQGRPTS